MKIVTLMENTACREDLAADHGLSLYIETEKHKILSRCHFGLNVMKDSVCVGLTMKSVDYFRHGLPIVNTIPADTARFVESRDVGVNMTDIPKAAAEVEELIRKDVSSLRRAASESFDTLFSAPCNHSHCDAILRRVLGEGGQGR